MRLNNNSPANVINFYLKEIGITQSALAKQFGVSQGAIAHAINSYPGKYADELRVKIISFIKSKKLQAA